MQVVGSEFSDLVADGCVRKESNWLFWRYIYSKGHNRLTIEPAEKWVYIKQNSPNKTVLPSDGAKTEWGMCLQLLERE
jgi:hypothetical protein